MDQPYTIYPEGIGKHIVCIYGRLPAAAIQTACRGEPRIPPIIRHRGINSGSTAAAEREDN